MLPSARKVGAYSARERCTGIPSAAHTFCFTSLRGKQNVVAGRTEFRYFSFVPKRFPINFCHQGGVGYDQIRLRTVPGSVRRIACGKRLLDIPLDPFEGKPMPSLQIPLPRFLETRPYGYYPAKPLPCTAPGFGCAAHRTPRAHQQEGFLAAASSAVSHTISSPFSRRSNSSTIGFK